jgi:Na+/H+ antiporter NhaC
MIYYIIFSVLGAASLIATFAIGFSKQNQSEDDQYTQKTKKNIWNLSYLNILFFIVLVIGLIVYLS